MATYTQVRNWIQNDMHRNDLTAEVQTAMSNTLDALRMERFWFNETVASFTVTLTSDYAITTVLPTMLSVDTMRVWQDGSPSDMTRCHWLDLQGYDPALSTGRPHSWAVHHQMLRVYPTPNTTAAVEVSGLKDLSLTAWCSYAPTLVRAMAQVELYTLVMHDEAAAVRAAAYAAREKDKLQMRSPTLSGDGDVRPYL